MQNPTESVGKQDSQAMALFCMLRFTVQHTYKADKAVIIYNTKSHVMCLHSEDYYM